MYKFEAEYRKLFEKPIEEIKEDIFFRTDNFQNEKWYGDLQMYLTIGVCTPDRNSVSDLQKALKILGYSTRTKEHEKQLYLVPLQEIQRQSSSHRKRDLER